uniref:Uncharacterized protein n=1 Tax=uncultured marine virus TaxID=186617 RepID=A0A0F7L4A7_9VIRU|nr:hypothetical protein [uncultured marine virus]
MIHSICSIPWRDRTPLTTITISRKGYLTPEFVDYFLARFVMMLHKESCPY